MVFLRLSVLATYNQVLKHLVCDFRGKIFALAFQKFPTSLQLRGKTYIPLFARPFFRPYLYNYTRIDEQYQVHNVLYFSQYYAMCNHIAKGR